MNKEEILQQITWDSYGIGKITLFVPIFKRSLPFVFFAENADSPTLTDKMVACVGDESLILLFCGLWICQGLSFNDGVVSKIAINGLLSTNKANSNELLFLGGNLPYYKNLSGN